MKEILEKYESIITGHEIIEWDSEPTSYRLKAKVAFVDETNLIAKDYIFSKGRKYSFHWQDKGGNLICRWDNTTHWKDIDTFPHHKHEKNGVFPSKEVMLEDILSHIYETLKR
jgi:hypothetical protein